MRYQELDGLRGIAAITVVFNHFLLLFPIIADSTINNCTPLVYLIKYTPLHLFWAGHQAVILFYILSGFVLSLPFFQRDIKYSEFVIKRICRIYTPYVAAILFCLLTFKLFSRSGIGGLSGWFNMSWIDPITAKDVFSHFALIGYFNTRQLNNAIWSLVHEMRISLVFPFIMMFVQRYQWEISLIAAFLLAIVSGIAGHFLSPALLSICVTNQYILIFVAGILLAKNRVYLIGKFKALGNWTKAALFVAGVLLYTYPTFFYEIRLIHMGFLNDWGTACGSSILIIGILSHNRLMVTKPVYYLGKISYSLYLFHLPVLFGFVYLLWAKISIGIILGLAFVVSILLATASYYYIEIPSIELGKRLTNAMGFSKKKIMSTN